MAEYYQSITNGSASMKFGHTASRNGLHFPSDPAGIIVIMNHQIHKNPARFVFIEEPIARWLLRPITAAVQTNHTGFTDLSFFDCQVSKRVFRKKTDDMGNEQLYARLATGIYNLLCLSCRARQWFFADNMFSCCCSLYCHLMMQMRG